MFKNRIILLGALIFLVTSCESLDSVKRGLTGAKKNSTDEFLVKKKDPLILPPDFENLPAPSSSSSSVLEDTSSLEETLKKTSKVEDVTSTTGSTERSILQEIKKK